MGKKGNWFVAVKKAFSPESKEKKHGKSSKSKHRWICRTSNLSSDSSPPPEEALTAVTGDAKFTETTAVPTEEAKSAQTITAVTEETKVPETVTISTERKTIDGTVAIAREEPKAAETVRVPTEEAKLEEDVRASLEETKIAETPRVPTEEMKFSEAENSHAYSVAVATAIAAEAAVAAAQAAAEVVRLTTASVPRFSGKRREDMAATKIQTAFRGYLVCDPSFSAYSMARRALRALRGLVRLKALIEGNSVKRQATATLRCMQTLSRVQSQIRSRRLRMSEENQTLQRQLLLKRQREFENLKASMGEDWDDSPQSKEQAEAKLITKQEAAIRRERALAYAFTHQQQWKNSSKSSIPMFLDPNNPHWGWSWLERWMAARPWENRSVTERDHSDTASIRTATRSAGEITKSYGRRETSCERPSPVAVKPARPTSGPSTPQSKPAPVTARTRLTSPRSGCGLEEESRSMFSMQSERSRRHSIGGSSNGDDESLASSPSVPSYMQPTKSARAKVRLSSPLGDKQETVERTPFTLAKKRLSFPIADKVHSTTSSVSGRRFSGPPKVETSQKLSDVH
ncbi:IQ-DOMAIN 1 protein [Nymphaea thermarum]|nr:IQ-DOMAIN 1 protein [Nymphaea thermarum]